MKQRWGLALLLGLLLGAGLQADVKEAQAAYGRGLALERAKDYQAAITEYEASLAAEPRYAYAKRQIGTCRYYLGDKVGALKAYDNYLAVVSTDAQTRAFADKLRDQLKAAGVTVGGGEAGSSEAAGGSGSAAAAEAVKPWRLGADIGLAMLSFKAWNDDWKSVPATSGSTYPTIDSAITIGMLAGYRVLPKLELGLNLDYILAGVGLKATISSGAISVETNNAYRFYALWTGPYADYDLWSNANGFSLNGGLGLGYLTLLGAGLESKSTVTVLGAKTESSSSTTYSGSTFGFLGKLGLIWEPSPRFKAYFDAGYRLASIAKVSYSTKPSTGASVSGTLGRFGPGQSGDMPLDYSGLDLKLGVAIQF